jgi:CDP-diglyceride synthetase
MGTIKLLVLFIPAAFVAAAAWESAGILQRSLPGEDDDGTPSWLDVVSGALLVMPILVVVLMGFVIFLVIQDAYLIRAAHTFFLLGLWMSGALSVLAIPSSVQRHSPSIVAMVDVAVVALAVVYFTPISHFVDALPPVSPIAPLIAGLGVVAVAYAALVRVRRALAMQQASLPEALSEQQPSPDTGPQ